MRSISPIRSVALALCCAPWLTCDQPPDSGTRAVFTSPQAGNPSTESAPEAPEPASAPTPANTEEELLRIAGDGSAPPLERARAALELGQQLSHRGQLEASVLRFELAADLFTDDPGRRAEALNWLSDAWFRLGDFESQEGVLWQALEAADRAGSTRWAATAWNNLGVSYSARGQPSAALHAYERCLELRQRLDHPPGIAATRHNLGVLQLLLGRVDEGLEELRRAEALTRPLGDPVATGETLASIAWGRVLQGRPLAALEGYDEAVGILDGADAWHDLAIVLEQRSQLHRRRGHPDLARTDLERSLALLSADGDPPPLSSAYLRLGLAAVRREQIRGTPDDPSVLALIVADLRHAQETFDSLGAYEGRILSRLELARALRTREEGRAEAIETLERAIEIVEAARGELHLPSFRATFLGGWQVIYGELVDLLATASLVAKSRGFRDQAEAYLARSLEVAEQAKARALLDRLAFPARHEAARAEEPVSALETTVETLEAQALHPASAETIEGSGERGAPAPEETRADLRRARFELDLSREATHRSEPPSPIAQPASFESLRAEIDAETTVLVYQLGPERSWLWRLERDRQELHALPPGPDLEAAARNTHELLPLQAHRGYGKATDKALVLLSRLLLSPIDHEITRPRLVLVPDGALHLVPFAALPLPTDGSPAPEPLGARHEIVHLPSASTLTALRHRASQSDEPSETRSGGIALVVDPVFESSDPRLGGSPAAEATSPRLEVTRRALSGRLGRLPATAEEGQRIAAIAEQAGVETETFPGFEAHRELVTGGTLDPFRILHFATHGVVDAEDPALAGLVLSLYDAQGQPRDGLLRTRDLYRHPLAADLVVLSACRTALGQEIRGEGLVGLADAFFAAGARQLVVSLWDVDDRATAALMTRFYRHLLLHQRGPAAALHHAQAELRHETEWRSPSHWAAFVAVGDWEP